MIGEENLIPEKKLSSLDIEMSIIGSIFSNSDAAHYAVNQLNEKDFYNSIPHDIFKITQKFYSENYSIDKELIELRLKESLNGESNKHINFIHKASNFCSPEKIEHYCRKIQDYSFRRNILKASDSLKVKALDLTVETDELREELEKTRDTNIDTTLDIAQTPSEIEEEEFENLTTGVKEWDEWFYEKGGRGLGTTELIFARPGHGKTYYLTRKIGQYAKNGYKWLHFPLEDVVTETKTRVDAVVSPSMKENNNILVIHSKRYLHDILKYIRYYKKKYDIKGVSVDHLGRVKVRGFRSDQKVAAMIETSNSLTDTISDLKLNGIWAVQPNKSYKGRSGWDNLLREEDLKGASEIFEDAFVVTIGLRPNIYPELRGGVGDQAYVKSPDGKESLYDSVFWTQIKNRRQRITDEFLHMIQYGNILLTEREMRELGKIPKSERKGIEDHVPF